MADLQNTITWSLGRREKLCKCPRLYYLRYYEHWNGWDSAAPERKKLAYQLSKMTSVPAFSGVAAHDAIAQMAVRIKCGATELDIDEAAIRRQMDIIFAASERGEWKRKPKAFPPFFEDVYGKGTRDLREDAKARAVSAVREWAAGPVADTLVAKARDFEWLFVDGSRLTNFIVNDTQVFCQLDLAVAANNRAFVFDWKTGRPGDSEAEQMRLYALFTADTWGYAPDKITARVVYLGGGYGEQVFKFDADSLQSTREGIEKSIEEMRELHQAGLAGDERSFAADKGSCSWCDYKLIC